MAIFITLCVAFPAGGFVGWVLCAYKHKITAIKDAVATELKK